MDPWAALTFRVGRADSLGFMAPPASLADLLISRAASHIVHFFTTDFAATAFVDVFEPTGSGIIATATVADRDGPGDIRGGDRRTTILGGGGTRTMRGSIRSTTANIRLRMR